MLTPEYIDRAPDISIHAPHEGERRQGLGRSCAPADFNPRSPRGGATAAAVGRELDVFISIHAPHEGERRLSCSAIRLVRHFNPRSPRGGAKQQA